MLRGRSFAAKIIVFRNVYEINKILISVIIFTKF